jgi:hypothetical protein
MYVVCGGLYQDTNWTKLLEPYRKEFVNFEQAFAHWQAMSWRNVDTCCYRLTIIVSAVIGRMVSSSM